jgi:hypothetical protein
VIKLGITPHAGNIPADLLYSGIQLLLPATRDKDVSALFNEQPGGRQRYPWVAPVMTATFPSSFFGISVLLRSHSPHFSK